MLFESLLAHLVGDYILQSEWMAGKKTERWWPAIAHGVTYALPFLLVTQSPWALLVIAGTHVVIDHWQLALHVMWLRNFLAPKGSNIPWKDALAAATAKDPLRIVADNTIHLSINTCALLWLA